MLGRRVGLRLPQDVPEPSWGSDPSPVHAHLLWRPTSHALGTRVVVDARGLCRAGHRSRRVRDVSRVQHRVGLHAEGGPSNLPGETSLIVTFSVADQHRLLSSSPSSSFPFTRTSRVVSGFSQSMRGTLTVSPGDLTARPSFALLTRFGSNRRLIYRRPARHVQPSRLCAQRRVRVGLRYRHRPPSPCQYHQPRRPHPQTPIRS
jgi:hypothetical protein